MNMATPPLIAQVLEDYIGTVHCHAAFLEDATHLAQRHFPAVARLDPAKELRDALLRIFLVGSFDQSAEDVGHGGVDFL